MIDQAKRCRVINAAVFTLLLVSGLSYAADTTTGDASDSRLPEAARKQDQKAVRALLNQKADVNARSSDGSTALLWAGALERCRDSGSAAARGCGREHDQRLRMTPLSQACTNGNAALVRLLLKSGANPNTPIATGETPLMTCAKTGSVDAVKMLIEYGAAIDAEEPTQNQTALMWAAAERHPDVVQALIEAHADLKSQHQAGIHRDALRGPRRRPGKRKVIAGRGSGRQYPDAGGRQCKSRDVAARDCRRPWALWATLRCWSR